MLFDLLLAYFETSGPTSKRKFALGLQKTEAYIRVNNWKPFYGGCVIGHEILSKRSTKAENKGEGGKEKETP